MTGHNRTTPKKGHPNHMVVPICQDCGLPIYAYRIRDQKRCRPCWTKYSADWKRLDNARRKARKRAEASE